VHKQIFITWRKHKAAAELKRVLAQLVLFVSSGLRATAGLRIVFAQQMKKVGMLQADGFVGLALVVDKQGKIDFGFLAEEAGIFLVAQADHGDTCALLSKRCCEFAQLRDMLAAENSTIMAQKDQHRRPFLPQGAKARCIAVRIRERDTG
jgi:hypothetical protein